MQPFEELNSYMRNMEDRFTKREMIAMHMLASVLANEDFVTLQGQIAFAIKATDQLLEELRDKVNVAGK